MADSTYVQAVGFAPQVAPYAETLLGNTQALINQPWKQYTGERQAQFSPLQKQSFTTAGQQGFGTYTPALKSFTTAGVPQSFMSPYMQNVVERQQADAQRQADIATTQRNSLATQQGAFGGSRQAVMDAEAARNLALQKGDIQAQGLQSAFQQAQGQFNTENQLQEQARQFGSGFGLQALNLQNQFGAQQQQQANTILANSYQDWLDKQNYPFKNLAFMSDVVRGAPTTNMGTQMYTAPPSMLSQIAGLGALGYGLTKKAAGGSIQGAGLADLALSRAS